MPRRSAPLSIARSLEDLRQGTREQFESDWVRVEAGATKVVPHDIGEIPMASDGQFSAFADGQKPTTLPAGVTLTRDASAVTVVNGSATGGWFKVRAN